MKGELPNGLDFVESLSAEAMVHSVMVMKVKPNNGIGVDMSSPASFESVMSLNALTLDEQIFTLDPGYSQ
jgi:hypothetical protein